MTMDARKQRVLQAIVALYGLEGEPVGSSVLANYFDMAVSSATLRNEMAALTKLGLLEQPHTSAGRVPSAKGYRYYLDNLLTDDQPLDRVTRARVEAVFASLDILSLLNDEEQAARIIAPPADRSESVLLGEDLEPQIPGLCIVSDRYLVGGGLWGTVALIGPTRMPFQKLMPLLHLFADELGEGMSGKRKDTPQMAAPRRTVIYKEDLE